jgi:hypothetical protein
MLSAFQLVCNSSAPGYTGAPRRKGASGGVPASRLRRPIEARSACHPVARHRRARAVAGRAGSGTDSGRGGSTNTMASADSSWPGVACRACAKTLTLFPPEVVPRFRYARSVIEAALRCRAAGASWEKCALACTADGLVSTEPFRYPSSRPREESSGCSRQRTCRLGGRAEW